MACKQTDQIDNLLNHDQDFRRSKSFEYPMENLHRGLFIIINNTKFKGMDERVGSDKDSRSLEVLFGDSFGFTVEVHKNVTANEMLEIFKEAASRKDFNRKSDCFGFAILSHGEMGVVYGTDKSIKLDELTNMFDGNNCPELIGKPKIFIIQACRGNDVDPGVEVEQTDNDNPVQNPSNRTQNNDCALPVLADFIYAYSTVLGYSSWRNNQGSWFISSLCVIFKEYYQKEDLLKMLTRVNRKVAYEFESNDPKNYKMRQAPCILSRLTKILRFTPIEKN